MLAEEAAEALKAAEATARRSTTAVEYQRTGRRLMLWGVVWASINIIGALKLELPLGPYLWSMAMALGVVANIILDLASSPGAGGRKRAAMSLALAFAGLLYIEGIPLVVKDASLVQVETLLTLALGLIYTVTGFSVGWRLSAVGIFLMLAVVTGSIWAPGQFFIWMAAAGGGGLILGGLWLRKV